MDGDGFDRDMGQVNLAEELNRRLNHNARRGNPLLDASVKPNLVERDRLDRLISAVSSNLSGEDLDLLYRYRHCSLPHAFITDLT